MIETITTLIVVLFALACFLFTISIALKRNDIADTAWGLGIALTAWVAAASSPISLSWPHYLLLGLISLWAVRLSVRIYRKNRTKPEDARYAAWRESWGAWFYPRSFLQIYLLQCTLMLALALSAIVAMHSPAGLFDQRLIIAGLVIWLIGFIFETIGDYQLDKHIQNPSNKGKMMTAGLWRYTRHPNYFGEITMWWGLAIMTLSLPYWWLALLSPITITVLIRYVSGVPMLEPLMEKYEGWESYKARTNMLIPWLPKK